MSQFPRMLYREGGAEDCGGLLCETRVVEDRDEQDAALEEGFFLTAGEAHGGEAPQRQPESVEEASDELEAMRDEIEGLKAEVEELGKAANEAGELLKTTQAEVERLTKENEQLKADLEAATAPAPVAEDKSGSKGEQKTPKDVKTS